MTNAAVAQFLRGEDANEFERCNLDTFHALQLAFDIVRSFGDEVINDFDSSLRSAVCEHTRKTSKMGQRTADQGPHPPYLPH